MLSASGSGVTLKANRFRVGILAAPVRKMDAGSSRRTTKPAETATRYPRISLTAIFNQGAWPRKAANVLKATIGFTIGDASMKVTPHETGSPLLIKRRTIGTMPHSQTGKHSPSRPLAKVARKPFFGSIEVMIFDGTKTAMAPEIREPMRTNGKPSKASAKNEYKKFCQVNVNQLIAT